MDKEKMVQRMFSSAAKRYDLNNSVLSFGIHHYWKRYAVEQTYVQQGNSVLDVCTGTADIAILLAKKVGASGHVDAVDLNREMLEVGRQKVKQAGLDKLITCTQGNAESLKFGNNKFDAITVGFGVRNVKHLEKAFTEMLRTAKPGGRVVCLEFTQPETRIFRYIYDFYSFTLLPAIGTVISRDKTGIYNYLPDSIRKFPPANKLRDLMLRVGFSKVEYEMLSGGIVAVHVGTKGK
ncbi:MAG: bifunctional demethylmenaquinone methyltransferase/2-methoxy-6-polyprenyl-1,4-benzoquinol methylase UbiE [Nitrospirae bacterium]|nr:bifunctional demethylmenaquinone methyltransferase/2-methoxy-6-polyprenyl-1,4-benzoquinol methylase UbiE [Nitrospirota bacterium]